MSVTVIEGTWEEIERHKAELVGRRLRVSFQSDTPPQHDSQKVRVESRSRASAQAQVAEPTPQTAPKRLRAHGMFAGRLSVEEYLREKREETAREDQAPLDR